MKNDFLTDLIPTILEAGEAYGKTEHGKGTKVQVEFVSVNPTGNLHLGHARVQPLEMYYVMSLVQQDMK